MKVGMKQGIGTMKVRIGLAGTMLLGVSWAQTQTAATLLQPANSVGQPASTPAVDHGEYVIGNEDVLAVNVWKEPELSRTVPVRPDGKITLPLVGEVQATGLTPSKLQLALVNSLKAYVSDPEVTVMVQEVKSLKFNIVGEINRPGSYPLVKPMTILDAIAVGGGLRDFAKGSRIYVLRNNADGSHAKLAFDYKQVIKGKKLVENVALESGDTIVIP